MTPEQAQWLASLDKEQYAVHLLSSVPERYRASKVSVVREKDGLHVMTECYPFFSEYPISEIDVNRIQVSKIIHDWQKCEVTSNDT